MRQARQRPLRRSHERTGTLSRAAIGVPGDELHKILAGNAVKLYKLQ